MALVGGIGFFIKLISFYKETLVASNFGLSELLDTFFIAMLVPGFISNVFLGSFRSVFIPNYIAEYKTGGNFAAFQGMGFTITGITSFIFMLFAYLVADVYVENFFPGHTVEYYQLIKSQLAYLLPCIMIWGFSSLLSGLLNINNEFKYTSWASIFLPLVVIIFLFFLKDELGDQVLAIGSLVGSSMAFIYLLFMCHQRNILNIAMPDFKNTNAILMLKQVPAKITSGAATGLNTVVDQYFAAQLVVGSIAAINYGIKIPAFISGLLVVAISVVLLPHFSKSAIENRTKTFNDLFKMMRLVFFGSLVIIIIGIIFSEPIIQLLFQRKEFTGENTEIVAKIQQVFLIYLPFSISGMLMVNFLTSINKNAIMAYIATVALVLNIILDYILMQFYGIMGIAICTTIVIIIKNTIMLMYIVKLRKKEALDQPPN